MSLDFGPVAMWFERQRRELAAAARAKRSEEQRAEAEAQRSERRRRARLAARHAARLRAPSHRMVLRSHLERAVSSAGVPGALSADTREALERFRGLCKCARCGAVGSRDFFSTPKRCTDCEMAAYERDPEAWFSARLARDAAARGVRVGVPCEIDAAWVRAAFAACSSKCALCGEHMNVERRRGRAQPGDGSAGGPAGGPAGSPAGSQGGSGSLFANFPMNASLDQRVAGVGYTRENVQLVHVRCNLAKLDMPQDDFIAMCKAVAAFHSK